MNDTQHATAEFDVARRAALLKIAAAHFAAVKAAEAAAEARQVAAILANYSPSDELGAALSEIDWAERRAVSAADYLNKAHRLTLGLAASA